MHVAASIEEEWSGTLLQPTRQPISAPPVRNEPKTAAVLQRVPHQTQIVRDPYNFSPTDSTKEHKRHRHHKTAAAEITPPERDEGYSDDDEPRFNKLRSTRKHRHLKPECSHDVHRFMHETNRRLEVMERNHRVFVGCTVVMFSLVIVLCTIVCISSTRQAKLERHMDNLVYAILSRP